MSVFYSPEMGIWGYVTFKHLKVFIEFIVHLTFNIRFTVVN